MGRVDCVTRRISWLVALLLATRASAHHSYAEYDESSPVEVTGTLLDVAWINPHVRFTVRALPDQQGKVVIWDIEAHSLSVLRRTSIRQEQFRRGDTVKVAGEPSRKASNRMFATHMLRSDGVELVLSPGLKPRWAGTPSQLATTWFDSGAKSTDAGLFRVWSSKLDDPEYLWKRNYPLTEAAKDKLASWDDSRDTVARGCEPKGMPTIMEQPYPIEFVKKGSEIMLRMEEYDTVRTIYMTPTAGFNALRRTRLGISAGLWEGPTLVVTTDRIDWPYLDARGVPLGDAAKLVERFTPSADGSRLNYILTVTSPGVFTEPVELTRSWVWRPHEQVEPYKCVAGGTLTLPHPYVYKPSSASEVINWIATVQQVTLLQ
jgi:hypothetical protein